MIGKTLAHYEITSQLGKGGMGEVYQAKDTKLGREVAIKVLPEEFARDVDRVARFQREAKLLASLNHPNIAAIYGLEESGGTNFLVMELVEGETLADQIKRGPIPVDEALKLALQIAEALEAAHEKGVIHRDLKPANIKVTPEGKVKVLDFGLAKAFVEDQGEDKPQDSPTLSAAATRQGVILGTAAYMSPEQTKGKTVDKRTDIWAFGVILYEMLTGKNLFEGEDVTSTLARVLERQPDYSALTPNLHPRICFLLERCLEKEARDRYSSISDARVDIQRVLADPDGLLVQPVAMAEPRRKLRILPRAAAALVAGLIIAGVAVWELKPPEPRQVMRFDYQLPEGQQLNNRDLKTLAISPDGKQLVYSTPKGLYLRPLDELAAKLIAGTEGYTESPFFSPDGKWVGYLSFTDHQLKKIAVNGGTPVPLCSVGWHVVGAMWYDDNTIVYAQVGGDIMRISADGGTPESLVKAKSNGLFEPQILPDGKSILYTAGRIASGQGRIMVQSLKSGETKELFAGVMARYLPTGYIVYLDNSGEVFAIRFNLDRLEVAGGQVLLLEGVQQGDFDISASGTLVYVPQTTVDASVPGQTLVWVDRKGDEEPIPAPPNPYRAPSISPDGTRIALGISNKAILVWDLVHKTLMRLTFERGSKAGAVWSPDGKRIAYQSMPQGSGPAVYLKAADGTGQEELLSSCDRSEGVYRFFFPVCWTRDGKYLVGVEARDLRHFDIGMVSIEGDHAPKMLLQAKYSESEPRISPDGRWIAFTSDESGESEIYVRPFPEVNKGHWQVSTNGGESPLWSPDGRELFFRSGDAVMAITVTTKPGFNIVGTPQTLFRGTYSRVSSVSGTPWDINPDGKRFLMMKDAGPDAAVRQEPQRINIVVNWLEELKQRVPVN